MAPRRGRAAFRLCLPFILLCCFALVAGGTRPTSWCRHCPPPCTLDLNRLSREELTLIPGFGPRRAALVIQQRRLGGPFASPQDLAARVKGIGPVLAGRLAAFVK